MLKTKNNRKKINRKTLKIKNKTPKNIDAISQMINKELYIFPNQLQNDNIISSYSPSINKQLVTLKSIKRKKMFDCNNELAFELHEPLQIGVPGNIFGKTCVPYYSNEAKNYLLKNLSANKHINVDNVIPPIQSMANCWFNTMFVALFISDKGRKFFHFFRQLMIEGKQSNNKKIPDKLRNSFALLNYAIEASLTGNKYAYLLDTNAIINDIYRNIPQEYLQRLPYIKGIEEAGNPFYYYASLMYYLNDKTLDYLLVQNASNNWKDMILEKIKNHNHVPHFIILEITDNSDKTAGISGLVNNKPKSFIIDNYKYLLDSCIIRDTSQQHFCSTLTCENKEMAYDGASFHRLVNMEWKKYINSNYVWEFEGSNNIDGTPLKWNFRHGYQMLFYFRSK
jgi:hypothetical protein